MGLEICKKRDGKLPTCLRWFDNADLYTGRDISVYKQVQETGLIYQYYWLALRNPLNYFGYFVLGYAVTQDLFDFNSNNNFEVGDSQGKHAGFLYTELESIYEYYYIFKYSSTHCFRFRMGHKIGRPDSNYKGSRIQYVFAVQPWKSFSGI
jgi:hypothetical protein